jgi:DNA replication protein DnaC
MKIAEAKVAAFKQQHQLNYLEESFVDSMARANIPVTYWLLPFSKFQGPTEIKDVTEKYIGTLKERYLNGSNLCFAGNYGVGKTYAISSILKSALRCNYTAYYTSIPDLPLYATGPQKDQYLDLCMRSDFLGLDELDGRHFSQTEEAQAFFGAIVEKILRYRVQIQQLLSLDSLSEWLNRYWQNHAR